MPWFRELAGIAFAWQGPATGADAHTTPIFTVVPPEEAAGEVVEFTLVRG
jgi:hypothetical protein